MINILTRRGFGAQPSGRRWRDGERVSQHSVVSPARGGARHAPGPKQETALHLSPGGNDGLNTVIPWGMTPTTPPRARLSTFRRPIPKRASRAAFRTVGSQSSRRFGQRLCRNAPRLVDLSRVFNDGQAALIHRVGYPKQSRSHFDSQRYWRTACRAKTSRPAGFLSRHRQHRTQRGPEIPAISVQSDDPLMLRGPVPLTTNLADPSRYDMAGITGSDN